MNGLRELSRELLSGALDASAAQPMAPRFQHEEVAPGVHFVSSFANVTAFDTDEGMVLVDSGSFLLAEPTRVLLRQSIATPAAKAIFTHGHVDHCFGVERYEAEPNGRSVEVIAHEAVARRFERYRLTHGYNARINGRQFQVAPQFPETFREPDVSYRDRLSLSFGGQRFELTHALGETDDHTVVWTPDRGVLCTGDLFIWASPNCGNPQKAQRYPREWAAALRAMARLDAEVLCPGHGLPIWGRAAVRTALEETAQLLESLVEQVLAELNQGATLDRILSRVRAPAALLERPYLRPLYDEPEFIVRNLVRLYGGWWDGNPANLKPAREADLARELCALSGGAETLRARAAALAGEGQLALACHLIELAAAAAPADPAVQRARAEIYDARAKAESSLMARGVFSAAAHEARERGGERV